MAKDKKSNSLTTLEIIQGISQAVSNIQDGARDKDGEPIKIGLKREEPVSITDKRIIDGFGIRMQGNMLNINYHGETTLDEVRVNNFENKISDILEQCISFIKKEYKKHTKKTLNLKQKDDPKIRVEYMNNIRCWVIANALYEISDIEKPEKLGTTWEERLDDGFKKWLGVDKKD